MLIQEGKGDNHPTFFCQETKSLHPPTCLSHAKRAVALVIVRLTQTEGKHYPHHFSMLKIKPMAPFFSPCELGTFLHLIPASISGSFLAPSVCFHLLLIMFISIFPCQLKIHEHACCFLLGQQKNPSRKKQDKQQTPQT